MTHKLYSDSQNAIKFEVISTETIFVGVFNASKYFYDIKTKFFKKNIKFKG